MFGTVNLKKLITSLIPPFAAGFFGWFFTRNAMNVYGELVSPPLSPPGSIFPIVWTVLYTLMGISFYIVRRSRGPAELKNKSYIVFYLQLIFNFVWTLLFFRLRLYGLSSIWLGVLIVLIGINIRMFGKINKNAGWLLVPYLLWCIFALYLNIGIYILN